MIPIADEPTWLAALLDKPAAQVLQARSDVPLDLPENLHKGREYIRAQRPIRGKGYAVAAMLKDYGVSIDGIAMLFLETGEGGHAWAVENATHAYKYGQNGVAAKATTYGVESVRPYAPPHEPSAPPHEPAAPPNNGPRVEIRSARGEKPVRVDWLWPGYLARGKFEILSGSKGVGKSTIIYDLGARLTAGSTWPGGLPIERPRDFLVWSGEDDFHDTILPRFLAAGGDQDRLYHVGDFRNGDAVQSFDPAFHTGLLANAVAAIPDLGMVLIDPIVSAVRGDSHKNAEVRIGLKPLIDLAAARQATLMGITHFTKGTQGQSPTERVTGSVAFGAAARVSLHAAKGEDEDGPRRFIMGDNNHAKSEGGFEYTLEQVPCPGFPDISAQRIKWGEKLRGSAKALLGDIEKDASKCTEAQIWLISTLQDNGGKMLVPALKRALEADGPGCSWRTLETAKAGLPNVTAQQFARKGDWFWVLTSQENPYADGSPTIDPQTLPW
jgi:putative DNA primase/helicase